MKIRTEALKHAALIALLVGLATGLVTILLSGATAEPQQGMSNAQAPYWNLEAITLASSVGSAGAQTAVSADFARAVRCGGVFSGTDAANSVSIEATVDGGTSWHALATLDDNTTITRLEGPFDQIRANVAGLGAGVDVTVECKGAIW